MTDKQGGAKFFEFGDHQHEREYPKDHPPVDHEPFHEGKHANEHNALDSKDQRSIKNVLAAKKHDEEFREEDTVSKKHTESSPSFPKEHPNRGTVIDAELEAEDAEAVKKLDEKHRQQHQSRHTDHRHPHHP